MDVPALIQHAQEVLMVNEAGLARRLNKGQPTVNRWRRGEATPDYESCLQLARITGLPAADVLRAAGHDPTWLPDAHVEPMSPIEADLYQRTRKLAAALKAIEGMDAIWATPYLKAVLDRRDQDVDAFIDMVLKLHNPVNRSDDNPINNSESDDNGGDFPPGTRLTEAQLRRVLSLS